MGKKKNTDSIIENLRAEINKKKAELNKIKSQTPKTNCSLLINGKRHNLHVISFEECIKLTAKLLEKQHLLEQAYNVLKDVIVDKPVLVHTVSGYNVDDWIHDIKNRLRILNKKAMMADLDIKEKKLYNLLSTDKKTQLEVDKIAGELGINL